MTARISLVIVLYLPMKNLKSYYGIPVKAVKSLKSDWGNEWISHGLNGFNGWAHPLFNAPIR